MAVAPHPDAPGSAGMAEPAPDPKLIDLLPAYETALKGEGRRPMGIKHYLWVVRVFIAWAGPGVTARAVIPDQIETYRNEMVERGCALSTVKNNLQTLRCFFRWCVRKGYCSTDPMAHLVAPRVPQGLPRGLKKRELRVLIDAIRLPDDELSRKDAFIWQRNRALIYLMLYTGLRISEVAALRWRDVDLDDDVITVVDGKGGKSRVIPIHPALRKELETIPKERCGLKMHVFQQFNGKSLNRGAIDAMFRGWLVKRGVEGLHAHRLRHTFATRLIDSGAHIRRVQKMMGHESIETTSRYLLLEEDEDRAAIRGMPYLV
jgi:site-specific recombinase XerD